MIRICGANGEQPASARQRCWCGGVFCGRGGARRSTEFKRDFKTHPTFLTRADFDQVITQADLFDQEAKRTKWRERIPASANG